MKGTSKVIGTISLENFEVTITIVIHFKYKIDMADAVSTLWRVIIFGWNKAAEKTLHESKNSREMLISTTISSSGIKHNTKVGKLAFV